MTLLDDEHEHRENSEVNIKNMVNLHVEIRNPETNEHLPLRTSLLNFLTTAQIPSRGPWAPPFLPSLPRSFLPLLGREPWELGLPRFIYPPCFSPHLLHLSCLYLASPRLGAVSVL